jgi:hypothetical protein
VQRPDLGGALAAPRHRAWREAEQRAHLLTAALLEGEPQQPLGPRVEQHHAVVGVTGDDDFGQRVQGPRHPPLVAGDHPLEAVALEGDGQRRFELAVGEGLEHVAQRRGCRRPAQGGRVGMGGQEHHRHVVVAPKLLRQVDAVAGPSQLDVDQRQRGPRAPGGGQRRFDRADRAHDRGPELGERRAQVHRDDAVVFDDENRFHGFLAVLETELRPEATLRHTRTSTLGSRAPPFRWCKHCGCGFPKQFSRCVLSDTQLSVRTRRDRGRRLN